MNLSAKNLRCYVNFLPLLICISTLVDLSIQLNFCANVPSRKGNFSFVAKSWPLYRKILYRYDNAIINCSTNVKNASVTLEYNEAGTWEDVMAGKSRFSGFTQNGQVFHLKEATTGLSIVYRCTAQFGNINICLTLGGLRVLSFVRNVSIQILPPPRPLKAIEGGDLRFSCEAHGTGIMSHSYLKWYKRAPSGRFELDKSLVLRESYITGGQRIDKEVVNIKSVKKSDSGTYICERDHTPTGFVKFQSVEVAVESPTKPYVKLIPSVREVRVIENKEKVKIVCSYVSGLPRPTMKWTNPHGMVVHDCDEYNINCTLEIYSADYKKNNGRYTCQATNRAGTYSIDVRVNVLVPVVLQKTWKKEVGGYKDKVELTCTIVRANPLPRMTWFYQPWSCASSVCIPEDNEWTSIFPKDSIVPSAIVATNVSKLTVPAATSSAFYSCQADNQVGKDTFNLTLHRAATVQAIFRASSSRAVINMNETFVLNCTASSNIYKNIKWLKNGIQLKSDFPRIKLKSIDTSDFLRVKTIVFSRLLMSDAANYTCVGIKRRDGVSRVNSQIVVKALATPVISNFSDLVVSQAMDNVLLTCQVKGNPLPMISWKFDNKALSVVDSLRSMKDCSTRTSGVYHIVDNFQQNNQLVICHLNYKTHQGEYKCIAENKVATVKKKISVIIYAKPKILKWANGVSIEKGATAYLVCEAEGNPYPNVTLLRIQKNETMQLREMQKYGNGTAYALIKASKESVGKYMCLAKNSYGQVSKVYHLNLAAYSSSGGAKSVSSTVIAVIIVCAVVFVVLVVAAAFWHKRKIEKKFAPYLAPNSGFQLDPDRSLFEQSGELPYDPDWEFPRERLSFLKMIGSGAFGEVWLAEAQGILTLDPRDKTSNASKRRSKMRRSHRYTHMHGRDRNKSATRADISVEKTMVAVKSLKGDASDTEYKDLASELKILIHIGENKHIVNLLGACTRAGKLCVILEYCPHGSLLYFLRERREIFEPTWSKNETDMGSELTYIDLTMVGYQVAKGMDFLASKKCIHRDLAARNVLVGVDYIVKIADFGLARDIYKDEFYMKSTSGLLPVKWMAPESLFDKVYTAQSDVWSLGIVLWEIFTLGGSPYPGLPTEDLFSFLEQGRRMEQSELCPLEIYAIMRDCWERYPNDRPLFSQIVDRIGQIISNHAGNENSYLRFDKEDGPIGTADSDYLLPVDKRGTFPDDYIESTSNNSPNKASSVGAAAATANYQNDDEIRLNLIGSADDDLTDYANANPRRYSDENEAIV